MFSFLKRLFQRKLPAFEPAVAPFARSADDDPPLPYKVYTREFDLVVDAKDVSPPSSRHFRSAPPTIAELRKELEIARGHPAFGAAIASFRDRWTADVSLGAKPLVTLLVDHSGSMRGPNALLTLHTLECVASALEAVSVPFEVLGFTTVSWRGGESKQKWIPAGGWFPGRLCDLLHIIYRAADEPTGTAWRDALTVLLDEDQLKENVDGEALQWAYSRALAFGASTWICIHVSDGAPVDDTTLTYNGPNILWDHFVEVIAFLTTEPNVRIGAIGIGYDLSLVFSDTDTVGEFPVDPNVALGVLKKLLSPDFSSARE